MWEEFEFDLDFKGIDEVKKGIEKCKSIPEQVLRQSNDYVMSEVILDTPVKTGRLRKGWHNALMRAQENPVKKDGNNLIIEDENTTVYSSVVEFGGLDDWGHYRDGTFYATKAVERAENKLDSIIKSSVTETMGFYFEDNKGLSKEKIDFYRRNDN